MLLLPDNDFLVYLVDLSPNEFRTKSWYENKTPPVTKRDQVGWQEKKSTKSRGKKQVNDGQLEATSPHILFTNIFYREKNWPHIHFPCLHLGITVKQ